MRTRQQVRADERSRLAMKGRHRRHRDDDIVDDVHMSLVPRFKTSGMSGDGWRVSCLVEIKRKGTVLFRHSYASIETAAKHLPWVLATMYEGIIDGFDMDAWLKRIEADELTCAQPGCSDPAHVFMRFKQIFAPNGEGPLPGEGARYVTGFCQRHSSRGTCSREDSDGNYEVIKGTKSAVRPADEKPSVFGGVIKMRRPTRKRTT